jgi:hypothetical protein
MSSASDPAPSESSVFLITTEGDRGRSLRRQSAIGAGGLFLLMGIAPSVMILGYGEPAQRPDGHPEAMTNAQSAALLAATCGTCALAILWSIYFGPRGVWALDRFGIEYQPLRGKPRRLAWADVEAIHAPWALSRTPPRAHTITFRSRAGNLPLVLFFEEPAKVQPACAAIVCWLGDAFDLSPPPSEISLKRIARMTAIAVLVVVVWAALLVWLEFADPYREHRLARICLYGSLILCCSFPFVWHYQGSPYWRYRRSSS